MGRGLQARNAGLPAAIILTVAVGTVAALISTDRAGLIRPAHAQTEAEKRKKEQDKHKAAPARPHTQPAPSSKAPPRVTTPPPPPAAPRHKQLPPPEKPAFQKQLPPPQKPALQKQLPPPDKPGFQKHLPPPQKPALQKPLPPPDKPAFQKQLPPPQKPALQKPLPPDKPGFQKQLPPPQKPALQKQLPSPGSGQNGVASPPKGVPPQHQKPAGPIAKPPSGPATVTPAPPRDPLGPKGTALKRVEDVKKLRIERVEADGRRKVIEEPGKRFIVKEHGRTVVRHDEAERFLRRPGARSDRRPDGSVETVYVRPDGVRIVTVVDAHGRLLRRYRRDRDGREHDIIDNRRFYRNAAIGLGIGALGIIALNLPPPRVTIPAEKYIVDYEDASDDDLYEALDAPPIEDLDRAYSLEEIRDNYELRARVRSIDINTINFDSGAWEIPPDQYDKLERVARVILRILERNPEAVFMIAGHTDAVGSDDDNASLSDRRASAVADVLTERYDVPAENLVTQGYGEQYLKIDTQEPEPRNRRVTILNITELMAER